MTGGNGRIWWAALAMGAALLATHSGWCQTRAQFEQARQRMVEEVVLGSGVKDERVVRAMRQTPRHEFVALQLRPKAYLDMALPIGDKQTISSPFIVSYMTQSLDPQPSDKVLEIGTGSGFQAAVLSPLVKDVYTIEIVKDLGEKAARTLQRLSYQNVHVKVGDGFQGWPEHAPFDKIIVTCSPEKVPQPLADQLAEGGLMVIPVGERYQQTLYLYRKKGGKLEAEALLPTLFVPMTGKAEDNRQVKPDPAHPAVANGSFEQEAFPSGAQPGWYYERNVKWESDGAPEGKHFVRFHNLEPGLPAHLLQGFAVDGRKVQELDVSALVKTKDALPGNTKDEQSMVAVTLYDDNRRELGHWVLGPFRGTADWHQEQKRIRVPATAREGIVRIGLFGGVGEAAFDHVQLKRVSP